MSDFKVGQKVTVMWHQEPVRVATVARLTATKVVLGDGPEWTRKTGEPWGGVFFPRWRWIRPERNAGAAAQTAEERSEGAGV